MSLRQCDVKECPAVATTLIIISDTTSLIMCSHHANTNLATFLQKGYAIVARPDLATASA